MNIAPNCENELMLARLLGIEKEQAAERLNRRVLITAGEGCAAFTYELREELERTVHVVTDAEPADLEIVIGTARAASRKKPLFVELGEDQVTISTRGPVSLSAPPSLHGLQIVIGACYAASMVLSHVIEGLATAREEFVIRFDTIGAIPSVLKRRIVLTQAALAGAGAVGNGFLRAARHLDVSGNLIVADPKNVGAGNPNRCLYFDASDVGRPKAERLSARAQADFAKLVLIPKVATFADVVRENGRIRRAIVATDSRSVRRSIQKDLPLEVLDASTTDVSEIIVHSHRQPTEGACLACIYRHIPDELARERDIASGLGIPLADVVPGGLINSSIADKIVAKHPQLNRSDLIGKAFDSLFKQLCAEKTLLSATGAQVLAPFAFVSSLAGAMLALELARFEDSAPCAERKNYMFLDPWRPPYSRLRTYRERIPNCEFCSRPETREALAAVWSEIAELRV